MSTAMVPWHPEEPRKPEHVPLFPYNNLPYTHVHPSTEGPRPHVLFRGHDCWCEPVAVHVQGFQGRPVAILLIHSDEKVPEYPKYSATNDKD